MSPASPLSPASTDTVADDPESLDGNREGAADGGRPDSRIPRNNQTRRKQPEPMTEDEQPWDQLREAIRTRAVKRSAEHVFGDAASGGAVYRWGWAASLGRPCDELTTGLSRLSVDRPATGKGSSEIDFGIAAEQFVDSVSGSRTSLHESAEAVLWAASMPALAQHLEASRWWDLLGALQQLRESAVRDAEPSSPSYLILGAELGLTLAWRLADLPSCRSLGKDSHEALAAWFDAESESIAAAVSGGVNARLVLASLVRSHRLVNRTTKRKFKKRQLEIAAELATWVAGMTIHTGSTAFATTERRDLRDDLGSAGLLWQSVEFDSKTLHPALSAALGESHSGGRLAWQVCLPEAMLACEDAKLAILLPDWDVRRGRIHLDYHQETCRLELFGGKPRLLAGSWPVEIELRGEPQAPCGPWTQTCEYSDDDVHYVELEQEWTGDLVLQRQVMQLRDDRCVLFADAVLSEEDPSVDGESKPASKQRAPGKAGPPAIRYTGRIPLDPAIEVDSESETREVFLAVGKKRRAMVLPLAAAEWRIGPSAATLEAEEDQLVHRAEGDGRLYAPIWIDLQPRRFRRPRTWRQLTIGDELRLVPRNEAAGYRIQLGSEQWMVYRSLGQPRCRTVLGKHLLADFLCTRFDMGDGTHDELITVDVPEADE